MNITLYGQDADNFLESYGIELYEDSIAIGESLFDGYDGECLLNENGIFLYEDCIVLEGEQAEAYKARKAKEAESLRRSEKERDDRRYSRPTGIDYRNATKDEKGDTHLTTSDKKVKNQVRRVSDANKVYGREVNNRSRKLADEYHSILSKDGPLTSDEKQKLINTTKNFVNAAKSGGLTVDKHDFSVHTGDKKSLNKARDPIIRHMRRHPKQYKEGTIFESVEFI